MEVTVTKQRWRLWVRCCLCTVALFACSGIYQTTAAQGNIYTIRNGKMHIELQKNISAAGLDSFINKFNLYDVGLKPFILKKNTDSIMLTGWTLFSGDEPVYVLTKPLFSFGMIGNPAEKMIFTEKHGVEDGKFAPVNNGIVFGYNRFRNKNPFLLRDSAVTFYLRNNLKATNVRLAGSFTNWQQQPVNMQLTDSGWIATVKLGPGKYWYKFIIDGNWRTDDDNALRESDGLGNINSVYFRTNVVFNAPAYNSRNVYLSGSFNNWRQRDLAMQRTADGWQLPIYLAEGTHTYKFVVDGQYRQDEQNPNKLPDGFGGFNSVIRLGKAHLFKLAGYTNAKQVMLTGNFNAWKEDELFMEGTSTGWQLAHTLGPGNYEYKFKVDGKWITDPTNPLLIGDKNNPNSYLIIQPNYTFRLKGFPGAKTVFLAGDFNNWSTSGLPMQKDGDDWVFSVHLASGKHTYKFLVDGKWIIDPANKLWEQNQFGTGNSVVWID